MEPQLNDLINNNWFTEIFGSLMTSIAIFATLRFLRPQIAISPKICRYTNSEGEVQYKIKVINKSWFHATNVSFELLLAKPYEVNGGTSVHEQVINLVDGQDHRWYISKRPLFWRRQEKKKNGNALYAIHVRANEDLEQLWASKDDSCYLVFKVLASHGLSSLTKVKAEKYNRPEHSILTGNYKFGTSLDIC